MQQIQIIGRIGQDAVIRQSANNSFTTFTLAVSDNYKDREGNKVERTDWYDVTTDNTNLTKYLTKGTQVFVQGKLSVGTYTNRDGKVTAQCKVSARITQLLSSAKTETATTPVAAENVGVTYANGDKTLPTGPNMNGSDDESNDLPF